MRARNPAFTVIAATSLCAGAVFAASAALAWDQDPVSYYFQRSDKITLSAGNAKDVNSVTHIIDPWPRKAVRKPAYSGQR